ncbi:MAG: hypothetical protein HRU19_01640 [Pseudobacteriovorax sp.]|nr:hypothetical protein [Pseudobacteriovorax sp.]
MALEKESVAKSTIVTRSCPEDGLIRYHAAVKAKNTLGILNRVLLKLTRRGLNVESLDFKSETTDLVSIDFVFASGESQARDLFHDILKIYDSLRVELKPILTNHTTSTMEGSHHVIEHLL